MDESKSSSIKEEWSQEKVSYEFLDKMVFLHRSDCWRLNEFGIEYMTEHFLHWEFKLPLPCPMNAPAKLRRAFESPYFISSANQAEYISKHGNRPMLALQKKVIIFDKKMAVQAKLLGNDILALTDKLTY